MPRSRRRKGTAFDGPLGCLIAIPAVIGMLLFLFLCVPVLAVVVAILSWRHSRIMKRRGRFISWHDLKPRLLRGEGTLLLETEFNALEAKLWWTDKNVRALTPVPVPPDELTGPTRKRLSDHPFSIWCYENFTSTETGTALLVGKGGDNEFEQVCAKVPMLQTGLRSKLSTTERRLLEILKGDTSTIIQQLIESLNGSDAELRDIVATTLGTFGPEAAVAVPALIKVLVDHDSDSSFFALIDVGPPAITPLKDLASHSDGELRKDAESIIKEIELSQKRVPKEPGLNN